MRHDPLLHPVLTAQDEDLDRALDALFREHVVPLVQRIVGRALGDLDHFEREDAVATTLARLAARLAAWRRGTADGVVSLPDYVAVSAYNVSHEVHRRRRPARARLTARIRYLARCGVAVALETSPAGGWVCRSIPTKRPNRADAAALFEAVQAELQSGAVPFDDLVDAVMRRLGEVDPIDAPDPAEVVDPGPSPEVRSVHSNLLQRLWVEILDLPRHQRVALLLNLRDPGGAEGTALLAAVGIADRDVLAQALELDHDQAQLVLRDLPRDDLWIAELLGVERRQVINMRKAARARLGRRLAAWSGNRGLETGTWTTLQRPRQRET